MGDEGGGAVDVHMNAATQLPLWLAYTAVGAALLSGIVSLGATRRHPGFLHIGSFALLAASGAAGIVAGGWVLLANLTLTDQLALGLPWLHWHLRLDPLSGFFFVLLGLLVLAISFYGRHYTREFARGDPAQPLPPLGVFTALFILGMQLMLLADDAFMFMVFWEMMSVGALLARRLSAPARRQPAAPPSSTCCWRTSARWSSCFRFGVLAAFGGGFTFDQMRAAELSPLWATLAFALAFIGFGIKAGMVPLHVWLPEAHPVAPSHISALMSGVMIKMGDLRHRARDL